MTRSRLEPLPLRVGGLRIFARACQKAGPDRPALVMVHGLAVSGRYFVPTAEALATDLRVFVPDLPGFGRSEDPPDILDLPALSSSVIDWMDAAGLERASFLGNSFGCQIVVDLAMRFPARVERIILQGPTVDPRARSRTGQILRWMAAGLFVPIPLIGLVLCDYLRCGFWRGFRTLDHCLRDAVEEKLPRVVAPTLVIAGTHDPLVPRRWAEQVASLLPDGRLERIHRGDHALIYSAPEVMARLVRSFLLGQSLAPQPGPARAVAAPYPRCGRLDTRFGAG